MKVLAAPIHLSRSVHIVYSEFPHSHSGNVYLLTGEHPTLIDCGGPRAVPRLLANLEHMGLAVTDLEQVIATHGDFDHIQGFHELHRMHPGLRIRVHQEDWSAIQAMDAYRTCGYLYGQPLLPFAANLCLSLEDGEVVEAGDARLTVWHAPGHTEGSVCLLGDVDGVDVLFAGDVVGGYMKSLQGAEPLLWVQAMETWEASLRRLSGLHFDWVLNGHEPAATLPLTRAQFDRLVKRFGQMLNPWFSLAEAEDEAAATTMTMAPQLSPS
jgi:glyoxylase-like metal-dependent hydrolase (beta-lactamase superfamily II)